MAKYTITVTPAEEKALLSNVVSVQDWLDNVVHNKARQCMDAIILSNTDKQPKKISKEERERLVLLAQVETAKDRNTRLEMEI